MEPEGGDFARDNRMVVTGTSRLVFAQKKRRYDAGQDLEEIEGCGGGCHGLSHLCQQLCVPTMACLPGVSRRPSACVSSCARLPSSVLASSVLAASIRASCLLFLYVSTLRLSVCRGRGGGNKRGYLHPFEDVLGRDLCADRRTLTPSAAAEMDPNAIFQMFMNQGSFGGGGGRGPSMHFGFH